MAKKAEEDLRKYVAADDENRQKAREFRPVVRLVEYKAGLFFCYDKIEVPWRFIESITVTTVGAAPRMRHSMSSSVFAIAAEKAIISIGMASGQTVQITCNRHELDILFDKLKKVWKDGSVEKDG